MAALYSGPPWTHRKKGETAVWRLVGSYPAIVILTGPGPCRARAAIPRDEFETEWEHVCEGETDKQE